MKRYIGISLALCLLIPGLAMAKDKLGLAGCGLGSLVFEGKPGPIQIVAATLNGTFGTQTFGITTGTSNCVEGGGEKAALDQTNFTKINFASLSNEAAIGSGEYIEAYAELFGCDDDVKGDFAAVLKLNHREIFAPKASADTVVEEVRHHLHGEPALVASCNRI
jgi:hypothetical protein